MEPGSAVGAVAAQSLGEVCHFKRKSVGCLLQICREPLTKSEIVGYSNAHLDMTKLSEAPVRARATGRVLCKIYKLIIYSLLCACSKAQKVRHVISKTARDLQKSTLFFQFDLALFFCTIYAAKMLTSLFYVPKIFCTVSRVCVEFQFYILYSPARK